ncbi:MAG: glycoside hydrolase family 28 protein [Armatimonadota bacterium]
MKAIITDYGAINDGSTINTSAIQAAVDTCAAGGGGTVVVPSGIFVTGSVELKSKVTLYLEQGAVLKASGNLDDYRILPIPSDEFKRIQPWIYALEQSNVSIAGDGELDLNDEPFIDWEKLWASPVPESELTDSQIIDNIVTPLERPSQMVFFHKCSHIRIEGIAARRSPLYTISISLCRDVKIIGITIDNNLRVPNNDGINFYACRDVVIQGCVLSCGDDCIAITSISNWDTVCERFVISDCTMTSRSSAIRIGHMASKVRDIAINNLVISDTNRGIGIFAGDNGWVKGIMISNITMRTRLIAGGWWGNGEPLLISAADSQGVIRGISFNNVRAHSENSITIVGNKGNVSDISLNNIRLTLSYGSNRPLFGNEIDLSPMTPRPAPENSIPWLYASEASCIDLHNIRVWKSTEPQDFSIEPILLKVDDIRQSDVQPFA